MAKIKYPYIWLFCGFAALGACLYGYDGVYFNGVSTLGMSRNSWNMSVLN
jgi:SP family sugar:H+ symporter-like MFS transporter